MDRLLYSGDGRLGLSRHAALKTRTEGDILVLPEQAIRVGGSGGEILRLVARGGTVASILIAMRKRYPESTDLEAEVQNFLGRMLENGGIVELDPDEARMNEE